MKYIQLSITSDIIGIREGRPEEGKDVICIPITDEAAEVAAELNNLREDCRLSAVRDGDGCVMTLAGKDKKKDRGPYAAEQAGESVKDMECS